MAYKKTNWQDTLRDAQGNVIQKGTPLNAQALGKIEDGIVATEQKIDNEISQVVQQLAEKDKRFEQPDFLETLRRYANFQKMQIRKIDNNNSVEVSVLNNDSHVTYAFINLGFDDYITQSFVYAGKISEALQAFNKYLYSNLTLQGTFVAPTESIKAYTQTVGDKFHVNVVIDLDDSVISFSSGYNNRGGIWRFMLNDDPSKTIDVSTNEGKTGNFKKAIFRDLPRGLYKVTGTFMGDDPNFPPTTSPSRGWLNTSSVEVISADEVFAEIVKEYTMATPSNKDFAFNIKPLNSGVHEFVPYHGTPSAFNASPKEYRDGLKVIDVASLPTWGYRRIESFTLSQHVYGRNSATGNTNLIEIWTNQSVNKDAVFVVDGKMQALEPINIKDSYVIMGVVKGDLFNLLVSSFNKSYPHSSNMYGQRTALIEEHDLAKNYLFLSSENKYIASAFRYNNIRETLRQAKSDKDTPDAMAYLQHRDANVLKLYNRLYKEASLPQGFILKFSGDYIFLYGQNFYDVLSQ